MKGHKDEYVLPNLKPINFFEPANSGIYNVMLAAFRAGIKMALNQGILDNGDIEKAFKVWLNDVSHEPA